jgi:hypothetical protein
MTTAEELEQEKKELQRKLEEGRQHSEKLDNEIIEANERQRLRRELDRKRVALRHQALENRGKETDRDDIDADRDGDFMPPHDMQAFASTSSSNPYRSCCGFDNPKDGEVNVTSAVSRGEYSWRLNGMSWLENALADNFEDFVVSSDFRVGASLFDLVYSPIAASPIDASENQVGSLAIRHREDGGVIFRYKIFIKKAGGDFVQWGAEGNECHPEWLEKGKAFGPDVQNLTRGEERKGKLGIFGLKHKELLQSEWVEDDALTVKVQLEVMEDSSTWTRSVKEKVDVPPSTMSANLLSMLEEEKCTDTTFIVDGKHIKAHSQILSARSEFFERELNGGLQESVSKVVNIHDTDFATFEVLLRYLYTDDFDVVEAVIKKKITEEMSETSGISASRIPNLRTTILQSILSVSHRYQVQRLRLWCEQQLCEYICKEEVCSLLCQAHLYEAKQLEKVCLSFIKRNLSSVVPTVAFGKLSAEWPSVMLRINIFLADVSEREASCAITAHSEFQRKRFLPDASELETVSAKRNRSD